MSSWPLFPFPEFRRSWFDGASYRRAEPLGHRCYSEDLTWPDRFWEDDHAFCPFWYCPRGHCWLVQNCAVLGSMSLLIGGRNPGDSDCARRIGPFRRRFCCRRFLSFFGLRKVVWCIFVAPYCIMSDTVSILLGY